MKNNIKNLNSTNIISLGLLYEVLDKTGLFEYLELIDSKNVPIIKGVLRSTKINFDISIFQENGVEMRNIFLKILSIHKEIKPLFLLIKYMLQQRNLTSTYTGGVNSLIILSLLYYYIIYAIKIEKIKKQKLEKYENILTLGNLLIGFLNFYGYEFNYKELGISITNGCSLYKRDKMYNNILSIKNCLDNKDMGIKCYNYYNVIKVFKYAYKNLIYYKSPIISFLNTFIEEDELLKARINKVYN